MKICSRLLLVIMLCMAIYVTGCGQKPDVGRPDELLSRAQLDLLTDDEWDELLSLARMNLLSEEQMDVLFSLNYPRSIFAQPGKKEESDSSSSSHGGSIQVCYEGAANFDRLLEKSEYIVVGRITNIDTQTVRRGVASVAVEQVIVDYADKALNKFVLYMGEPDSVNRGETYLFFLSKQPSDLYADAFCPVGSPYEGIMAYHAESAALTVIAPHITGEALNAWLATNLQKDKPITVICPYAKAE